MIFFMILYFNHCSLILEVIDQLIIINRLFIKHQMILKDPLIHRNNLEKNIHFKT